MDRERYQVVVAVGEGEKGRALKEALQAKADAEGVTLTVWARRVLAEAAGLEPEKSTLARLESVESRCKSLSKRLAEVEDQLGIPGP